MKFSLLLLFLSTSTVSVSSAISGEIEDTTQCGTSLIESVCDFEADPDRRRRARERRRASRAKGRRMKDDKEDEGADGFINECTVFVNGTEVDVTIKDVGYALVTYDEDVKGDEVELELFQSVVKVFNTTISGLYKLETFDYDIPNAESSDDDRQNTLKTFSVAWSGC